MSEQTFAKPPECPIYKNKQACLLSVADHYNRSQEFIKEMTDEEDQEEREKLIQASLDIKKYESLACQKTCFN